MKIIYYIANEPFIFCLERTSFDIIVTKEGTFDADLESSTSDVYNSYCNEIKTEVSKLI